jgi:HK97 family phage portal protein
MFLTRISPAAAKETRTEAEIMAILDGNVLDSEAGEMVNANRAMMQTTVWACTRIISEAIAQLPLQLQQQKNGQWQTISDHAALDLLAQPNGWQTQHEFLAMLVTWMELQGNGYALKSSGRTGGPKILIPVRSDEVEVEQDDKWKIRYKYQGRTYTPAQMLHLRNFTTESYKGLSTIANARNSIGLALAMEKHGAGVFKNGATVGLVIETPGDLGEAVYERLDRRLSDKYAGAARAHRSLILEGGAKAGSIGMNNEDSQWIESRGFNKSEIATLFGVPDFMLNSTEKSTTWGSGLEQLFQAFVRITLKPRMSRIGQRLVRELLPEQERRTSRFIFDTDQMTMGEFESRMTGYSTAVQSGVLNPNEARELEGRNPREGGDDYLTPMNMTTGNPDDV